MRLFLTGTSPSLTLPRPHGPRSYSSLWQAEGITTATIGGNLYAFVASWGNDAINMMNASAVAGMSSQSGSTYTAASQLPLVTLFNSANFPTIGSALDGPRALDYAEIG